MTIYILLGLYGLFAINVGIGNARKTLQQYRKTFDTSKSDIFWITFITFMISTLLAPILVIETLITNRKLKGGTK